MSNIQGILKHPTDIKMQVAKAQNDEDFSTLTIVKDILEEIFINSVDLSELEYSKQMQELQESVVNDITGANVSAKIENLNELTKKYEEEFLEILQQLKCKSMKFPSSIGNPTVEEQLKTIITEIRDLENSVRGCSLYRDSSEKDTHSVGSQTDYSLKHKSGKIELVELQQSLQEYDDEVVLQVIDHDDTSDIPTNFNLIPSDENLDEINLLDLPIEKCFGKGDQIIGALDAQDMMVTYNIQTDAGENQVPQPVPDPEPLDKLKCGDNVCDRSVRKKKKIGTRFWNFITKSSASNDTKK